MITFRQKEFFWQMALPIAAELGMGMKSNSVQKELAEEQSKLQQKLARKQQQSDQKIAEALSNIAEKAPASGPKAAELVMQQRGYSFTRNLAGLGKDLGTIVKRNKVGLIGTTLTGVAMGTAGYLTDKGIQKDMKKSGIPLPERPKKEEKKYSVMSSIAKSSGKFLKESGKTIGQAAKSHKTGMMMMAGMASVPSVLGYAAEKKAYEEQLRQTREAQKQYSYGAIRSLGKAARSIPGNVSQTVRGWGKSAKSGWKTYKSHPGQSTLGAVSNLMQGGGRKGVEKFGKDLEQLGRKNKSPWSVKLGKATQKYPKTAIATSIPIGAATMAVTWDAGQKMAEKTARKLDKDAFRYQDSQNQQIQ